MSAASEAVVGLESEPGVPRRCRSSYLLTQRGRVPGTAVTILPGAESCLRWWP
jgi:hypothetical protein